MAPGWNRYWKRSRFSHLDLYQDRLHFALKKLQTKMKNTDYFLPTIFIYEQMEVPKSLMRKISKENEQTLTVKLVAVGMQNVDRLEQTS